MAESASQRRKRLAQEAGFPSAYAQTKARAAARGNPVLSGAELTEQRTRRARSKGFATEYERQTFVRKTGKNAREPTPERAQFQQQSQAQRKRNVLRRFGITEAELNARDRANRAWEGGETRSRGRQRNRAKADIELRNFIRSNKYHRYREEIVDGPPGEQWSYERIGYILAYYAANVNPETNYSDGLGARKGKRPVNGAGFKQMNAAQYYYLTQFTDLMSVSDYESSYGSQQLAAAQRTSARNAVD